MRILRRWRSEVKAKVLPFLMTVALLGLALFGGIQNGQAQNLCTNPLFPGDFSLSKDKICVGSPITITNVPNTIINAKYTFQYDGKSSLAQIASSLSASTTFTGYSQPGSYTILQAGSGNGAGSGTLFCRVVTVLPLDPVKFKANPCSGRRSTLAVDATTLGQYDVYIVRWGDGTVEEKSRADMQNNPSHTYNASSTNTPTIEVDGVYGTATSQLCSSPYKQTVTLSAAATQPIITTLKTTSDKTIDLTYQAGTGASVQLYQKVNGTYTPTGQNGTGSGSFTVQTDATQTQCFQVTTQDACSSSGLSSDEVCSLVLDVKAANKQNNLSWQAYAGTATQFRFYRIYRNGGVGGQVNTRSATSYADANNIVCGTQYCYTLEVQSGATTITSSAACVNGISSDAPGTLGSTVVSIENNQPRIVSTLPTSNVASSYTLVVSRSTSLGGPFEPIGTAVNKNTYVDASANASVSSYCYQVAYQGGCGLTSASSEPVCTVFLTSKSASGIDWTAESPFTPEKVDNYIIEVIDSVNNTRQEITNIGLNTHYDLSALNLDVQAQKYRIITVSEYGTISYSNFFTFRREVKILVPDAFTPGNDDMNETFVAKGVYFDQFRMNIYDRWGEVIFTSTNKNIGWDGKINGQAAQTGQYMYRIEVTDLTGFKTVRTGAVLLVR